LKGSEPASSSTLTIREARVSDAPTLLGIQRAASLAAFRHIFPSAQPFPDEGVLQAWRDELASPDVRILIADRDGQPVGAASYAAQRFSQLWVVPEEWGSGAAERLYAEVMRGLKALGGSPCRLWVLENNHRARRFYERHGWKPDGRQKSAKYSPHPNLLGYSLEMRSGAS
jgi:GNAT superfamily N-acetyltransferase